VHYEYWEGNKQKNHWLICELEERLIEGDVGSSMAPKVVV
jgi:hypothetical protein